MATEARSSPISPRAVQPDFGRAVPRHWFAGHPAATHAINGVNLLFPAGERFFIRSVVRYQARIPDPALQAAIRGFVGQEGHHSRAHERFFEIMEQQGYRIRGFLRVYEAIAYGVIERVNPKVVRLAATAACEHFTAILAEDALGNRWLDDVDPTMRDLLYWHAAEEIEHKSVAFDVLQQVNPSYWLRVAGLVQSTLLLGGFWVVAAVMLAVQDRRLGPVPKAPRAIAGHLLHTVFLAGIRDYLRRDFHPSQRDNGGLARDYLASVGL